MQYRAVDIDGSLSLAYTFDGLVMYTDTDQPIPLVGCYVIIVLYLYFSLIIICTSNKKIS